MLDAACLHRRRDRNVGDLACSPGLYFDFGQQAQFDLDEEAPDCRLAILGGGQVFRDCVDAVIYRTTRARHRVIWGVGISPKDVAGLNYDILSANCALVSTRNWGVQAGEYVPCASAMSGLFDAPPAPVHPVVLFTHARKSVGLARPAGVPQQDNHTGTMADAVAFLARGETIVTNSFHGTYWGLCLGRKVLCLPFSRKFDFFRDPPVMAAPDDWPEHLHRAAARDGVLDDARARNRAFFDKVMNL